MRNVLLLYGLFSCVAFISCKTMKNLGAKDNSRPVNSTGSASNSDSLFLDNVSVNPGSKRVITMGANPSSTHGTNKISNSEYNIEEVGQVQFKYATILDIPVEDVSNLLLFENLDHWWGTRYCKGGSDESCIDCSAFTQTIMREVYSIHIPRTAQQQYDSSIHIESHELAEGDLVFFRISGRSISHVGVYIANNKFAHASVSSGVMISDLNESYWKARYRGAGRVNKYTAQR